MTERERFNNLILGNANLSVTKIKADGWIYSWVCKRDDLHFWRIVSSTKGLGVMTAYLDDKYHAHIPYYADTYYDAAIMALDREIIT